MGSQGAVPGIQQEYGQHLSGQTTYQNPFTGEVLDPSYIASLGPQGIAELERLGFAKDPGREEQFGQMFGLQGEAAQMARGAQDPRFDQQYGQAWDALGGALGGAQGAFDIQRGLIGDDISVNPYSNQALQQMAGQDVLGGFQGQMGQLMGQLQQMMQGGGMLQQGSDLAMENLREAQGLERDIQAREAEAMGLGGGSLGRQMMRQLAGQQERQLQEQMLGLRGQDIQAAQAAANTASALAQAGGQLSLGQQAQQMGAQEAFGGQELMGDELGLRADIASRQADVGLASDLGRTAGIGAGIGRDMAGITQAQQDAALRGAQVLSGIGGQGSGILSQQTQAASRAIGDQLGLDAATSGRLMDQINAVGGIQGLLGQGEQFAKQFLLQLLGGQVTPAQRANIEAMDLQMLAQLASAPLPG